MKNLKELRLKKGYSQNQTAQFLHIGSSTVFRWEQGISKPTLFQFIKLCRVLDCTPAQLVSDFYKNRLPVFDIDGNLITDENLTDELSACGCCFGIVIPADISPRVSAGDICFFSFDISPEEGRIVFSSYDNYNGNLCIFKEYDADMQIIAVCQFLHSTI
ncbi:MAG: helix-turn-helix transcriptional regulator [Oscillospiraceae bacterium]|nr:helix-turn-helix transcriptional regulator [Oscillospiraceae bacterium]